MSRFATDQSTDESDGSSDFHDVDFGQPALKRSLSEKGLELLNEGYSELDIPATLVFPEKLRRQVSYYFGAGASSRLEVEVGSRDDDEEGALQALNDFELSQAKLNFVFVIDTTGSMDNFISSIVSTLSQIFILVDLFFFQEATVSVIAYKDYSDKGQLLQSCMEKPIQEILAFIKRLSAGGGGDVPEAGKTAFNRLHSYLAKKAYPEKTIVMHFTDSPPHHQSNIGGYHSENYSKERAALASKVPGFDWFDLSVAIRKTKAQVATFMPKNNGADAVKAAYPFYGLLGSLFVLDDTSPNAIACASISVILALMGVPIEQGYGIQELSFSPPLSDAFLMTLQEDGTGPGPSFLANVFIESDAADKDDKDDLDQRVLAASISTAKCSNADHVRPKMDWKFFCVNTIPFMMADIDRLASEFKSSDGTRDIVFRSLRGLLHPEMVMALTYNPVMGRLWRLCCERRDDKRLGNMTSMMGKCVTSPALTEDERARLKEWLESSYDWSTEINMQILNVMQANPVQGFFALEVCDLAMLPSKKDLRSLATVPMASAVAAVQQLLSHVVLYSSTKLQILPVDQDQNQLYLPENMSDRELFAYLSHLIQPGTKFSLRPSALIAIMAHASGVASLSDRAARFLASVKGEWLPSMAKLDRPELLSVEFVRFMARTPKEFLIDEEYEFFQRFNWVWRCRRSGQAQVVVQQPRAPSLKTVARDYKEKCKQCSYWTSLTLIDCSTGWCGICLWRSKNPAKNTWRPPKVHEKYWTSRHMSYLTECASCCCVYAVLGPEDISADLPTKCHFCRGRQESCKDSSFVPPHRCCCKCGTKWLRPGFINNTDGDSSAMPWFCPACEDDRSDTRVKNLKATTIEIADLISTNPRIVVHLGFRYKAAAFIFPRNGKHEHPRPLSLYDLATKFRHLIMARPLPHVSPLKSIAWKGKTIINVDSVIEQIKQICHSSSFMETCMLCYSDKPLERMQSACGYCENQCCNACLHAWYSHASPGKLFLPTHSVCPFCRKKPSTTIFRKFNRELLAISGGGRKRKQVHLRRDTYYAWCLKCYRVQPAAEKRCVRKPPDISEFVCEDCKEVAILKAAKTDMLLEGFVRTCPQSRCQMTLSKAGGCNHMVCPKCGTHFCWECLLIGKSASEVYDHLYRKHGGLGFDFGITRDRDEVDDDW